MSDKAETGAWPPVVTGMAPRRLMMASQNRRNEMEEIATEARIIMPHPVSFGYAFQKELMDAFGGFTRIKGGGAWRDGDGVVHDDHVNIYDIAMLDTSDNEEKLRRLAIRFGGLNGQKAVYVRYASGVVDIVKVTEEGGDEPLGTRRLPKPGEVWDTASGVRAAVLKRSSVLDGGYVCVILKRGSVAMSEGSVFTVNLDGLYGRGSRDHPLNLVRFVSTF